MIKIRPYLPGDALMIIPKPGVFEPQDYLRDHTNQLAQQSNSYAHTILIGERPIGVVGGTLVWPGFAEVWALFSNEINKYPLALTRAAKRFLQFYSISMGIIRFQVTVRCDFPQGVEWVKKLGFKLEGTMPKFGPDGADTFLFGRIN